MHFGMTGRLLRDGAAAAIDRLAYGAASDDERWDRWVARLDDGSRVRFHDPRRLGRIWLHPSFDALGPDALTLTRRQLAAALAGRRAPLKAVLLDQGTIAGLGNMLVDEVLWWAGLDPHRRAASLDGRRGRRAADRRSAVGCPSCCAAAGATPARWRPPCGAPSAGAHVTARPSPATSSVAARPSGVRLTNVEPGKIWGAVPAAPPLLGSTGSTTFVLVVLLVALGVAMLLVAVWLVRATRTDTRALGPLEVMGDRRFGRRDEAGRSRDPDRRPPRGRHRAGADARHRRRRPAPPAPVPAAAVAPAAEPATRAPEPAQPAAEPAAAEEEPAAADEGGPDEPAEAAPQAH